jgi:hypothetical protein
MPREFLLQGSRIPDPDSKMNVEQVRELLTPSAARGLTFEHAATVRKLQFLHRLRVT